jgi:hypothetical protein
MQEEVHRMNIDPHYKNGNVFERDEAYYSQMLGGTRRTNLRNSRQPSIPRSQANERLTYTNTPNTLNERGA